MTMFSAVTLVLWLGARSVLDGTMTGGDLAKFLSYAIFMGTAVAALSEMWGELQRASGAMERTIELLQSRPSIVTPADPVALERRRAAQITFEHLSFNYPSRPDTRALDDFHLEIAPGETVAFVGPSGAGKSTVFQLLLRFYDPAAGRILIDGVDIALADPSGGARAHRPRAAGNHDLRRQRAREHPLWPPGRQRRGDRSRGARRGGRRVHQPGCRRATTPSSANAARGCRAARSSASPSRAPSSRTRPSCCSTRPPARWIRRASGWCRMRSRSSCATAPRWSSRTGWPPPSIPTASWSIDRGRIVGIGRHEELLRDNALYARLAALQFGERSDAA